MSPTDQPLRLVVDGGAAPVTVGLRFAEIRLRVAFVSRTAADGMLPALAHAAERSPGPPAATLIVRRRVDNLAELGWWERAVPLREQLTRVLGSDGSRVVHAAVVGDDRGGVILVGPRGAGKTTAALAAVRFGLGFVGDDYVLLRAGPPFEAVSLYSTASVRNGTQAESRQIVDVGSLGTNALRRSLHLRAVVVPRISGGGTRWRELGPAAALRAWAPSTVRLMTDDRGAALPLLSAAVRSLPCYSLDVGVDSGEVAAAVAELLDRAGSRS